MTDIFRGISSLGINYNMLKKKSYLFVCVSVDICSIARYVSPYITLVYRLFLLFIFSNYVFKLEIVLVSHSISFLCEEKFKFFCFYLNQLVFWIAAKMKLERQNISDILKVKSVRDVHYGAYFSIARDLNFC